MQDDVLAVAQEIFLLNKRFTLERVQRVWDIHRRWVNPHLMDGGYSLTCDEFLFVIEAQTDEEEAEARNFFDRMKVYTPTNQREQMDLLEFLITFTILSSGTWENKCKFIFHLMDFDIEDEIAVEELGMLISIACHGLHKMKILDNIPSFEDVLAKSRDGFAATESNKMNFNQFFTWSTSHMDPLSLMDRLRYTHASRVITSSQRTYILT
jgi:hypothetical protein